MRGSALQAPGWVQLVLAGEEEHPLVAVGIEDARVAPEPRSVDGPLRDDDAGRAQSGHVVVERCLGREFEAELRCGPDGALVPFNRESLVAGSFAAAREQAAVVRLVDDRLEPERQIEGARPRNVGGHQRDVGQAHGIDLRLTVQVRGAADGSVFHAQRLTNRRCAGLVRFAVLQLAATWCFSSSTSAVETACSSALTPASLLAGLVALGVLASSTAQAAACACLPSAACNCRRARDSRDITVPIGIRAISAISL